MRRQKESKSITELARELRNNPTPSERKLWKVLRKKQLGGHRFLRQKPIIYRQDNRGASFFIADFYCAKEQLVIEIDGKYHRSHQQKRYDRNRDLVIQQLGLRVLRIQNEELGNMDEVVEKIGRYLG